MNNMKKDYETIENEIRSTIEKAQRHMLKNMDIAELLRLNRYEENIIESLQDSLNFELEGELQPLLDEYYDLAQQEAKDAKDTVGQVWWDEYYNVVQKDAKEE